ncbi:MAG: TSUP family transporter [Myxococcales bacterium]|nr:TSUP family transporter [Myxococcales bacterium]
MTLEPLQVALLFGVGLLAGAINTIAGGGSLITLPALIFLGMPAPVANATNRVGVFLQSLTATHQFARRGMLPFRQALLPVVAACLGAAGGAGLGVVLDAQLFKQVIGGAMLVMLVLVFAKPKLDVRPAQPAWVQAVAFFFVGVYGGFLQAGVGFFLLFALVGLSGWALVPANGAKSFLVAVFTVPALLIFVFSDLIQWAPAAALAAGSSVGAWLGTKMAVGWGPKFVRVVLVVMVAGSATKLLGLW